jgi:hypothetical protein
MIHQKRLRPAQQSKGVPQVLAIIRRIRQPVPAAETRQADNAADHELFESGRLSTAMFAMELTTMLKTRVLKHSF